MTEPTEPLAIEAIATHDLPDYENSRLGAWFDMVDEIESAKDAT